MSALRANCKESGDAERHTGDAPAPARSATNALAQEHHPCAFRHRNLIAMLGLIAGLTGCGFHLEGRTPLPRPLSIAYVDAQDRQTDFVQGLRKALISAGAQLADDDARATAVVHVLQDAVTPRVLAVSPTNLPREYEITYTVRFSVTSDGKDLLPPQEVSLSRDYSFDEHILLAKDNEEAILRGALARDLVGVVMRRLASL